MSTQVRCGNIYDCMVVVINKNDYFLRTVDKEGKWNSYSWCNLVLEKNEKQKYSHGDVLNVKVTKMRLDTDFAAYVTVL